ARRGVRPARGRGLRLVRRRALALGAGRLCGTAAAAGRPRRRSHAADEPARPGVRLERKRASPASVSLTGRKGGMFPSVQGTPVARPWPMSRSRLRDQLRQGTLTSQQRPTFEGAEYEPGTCHSLIRAEAWSGAGGYASAEAEDELGVVGHLLRSPRWVERQLQLDVLDPLDLPRGAVDVLRDERAGRAAHGRQ